MRVIERIMDGVLLFEPQVHGDSRGFFLESFNVNRYGDAGLDIPFVQDNHSRSERKVLRGLHYQRHQGKLVMAIRGSIFDVAVDIRPDSSTYGKWFGTVLSDENHRQLYVPPGFAHGFAVVSEVADIVYKVTDYWRPGEEGGIAWNDTDIEVEWPFEDPTLSGRDQGNPAFRDIDKGSLVTCAELARG